MISSPYHTVRHIKDFSPALPAAIQRHRYHILAFKAAGTAVLFWYRPAKTWNAGKSKSGPYRRLNVSSGKAAAVLIMRPATPASWTLVMNISIAGSGPGPGGLGPGLGTKMMMMMITTRYSSGILFIGVLFGGEVQCGYWERARPGCDGAPFLSTWEGGKGCTARTPFCNPLDTPSIILCNARISFS